MPWPEIPRGIWRPKCSLKFIDGLRPKRYASDAKPVVELRGLAGRSGWRIYALALPPRRLSSRSSFRLTHILCGHGCFRKYLHSVATRKLSPAYHQCDYNTRWRFAPPGRCSVVPHCSHRMRSIAIGYHSLHGWQRQLFYRRRNLSRRRNLAEGGRGKALERTISTRIQFATGKPGGGGALVSASGHPMCGRGYMGRFFCFSSQPRGGGVSRVPCVA